MLFCYLKNWAKWIFTNPTSLEELEYDDDCGFFLFTFGVVEPDWTGALWILIATSASLVWGGFAPSLDFCLTRSELDRLKVLDAVGISSVCEILRRNEFLRFNAS